MRPAASRARHAGRGRHILIAIACSTALMLGGAEVHAADAPLMLEVKRFVVEGENPLSAGETEALLKPHLGRHQDLATLEAAAIALQEAIRARGFSFHRVIVPAQQPAAGELTLRILPFLLDQITVAGNQHFSRENVLRSLPGLKPGRAPNVGLFAQQLNLANEHPSKRLTLQVKEGAKPDTVDAEIRVADTPPSQFFVSLTAGSRDVDNTLNQNTGYTRVTLGYQNSNLFNRDHTGTIAYTTSLEKPDKVTQIGAFYTVPLYGWNTLLTGYYTYSDVDSGTVGAGAAAFDVNGSGSFYGLKAQYLLPRLGDVIHNVSVAWDERFFESNVAFGGTPVPGGPTIVGSRPITFRYAGRMELEQAALAGYVEYSYNLGGGRANDNVRYAISRLGADRDWDAYRYGLDGTYTVGGGWALSAKYRGQYASEALIPGEQHGIAGTTGVRGFREREVTGDKGYFVNLEVLAPQVATDLVPMVFYDFGRRTYVVPVVGQSTHDNISAAGAGLRWRWKGVDMNATWAHTLNGVGVAGGTPRGHDKLNFSAFYRF